MQGILPDSRKSYLLEENPTFARTFPTLGGIFSYLGGIFSYLKVGFFAFSYLKVGFFPSYLRRRPAPESVSYLRPI